MARIMNKSEAMQAKHLDPNSIQFSMFTAEDIRNLCVTKICTPLTFNALGYPLPGGLYDKTLGPLSDKSEPCGTCFKNFYTCPGHYGYIELPLPCVNPLFHKIIGTILKLTCLLCFRIQIPFHLKHCLAIQISLLDCGLVTEAMEIEAKIQELIVKYELLENIPEDAMVSLKQYETLPKDSTEKIGGKIVVNKNMEYLKNKFINSMLRTENKRKICLHCKKPRDKLHTFKNKLVLSETAQSSRQKHTTKSAILDNVRSSESKYVNPEESRRFMRKLWENERELLLHIVPVLNSIQSECPINVFYLDTIVVTPTNNRPVNFVNNALVENPQSQAYKDILQNSMLLRAIIQVVKNGGNVDILPAEAKSAYEFAVGKSPIEKLNNAWEVLQVNVDGLIDSDNNKLNTKSEGLKQIIEKKAGLLRMHMMGKRVNFSARSVITPDPNLNIDEIGVPEEFAKHLTYPVPVTSWNVGELRKMVLNGPEIHPGAVMVENEDGSIRKIKPHDKVQQESILKVLLTPNESGTTFRGVKRVHRHLCNGDILLLNRQPTLHKPSIMAHTARILKGEKTFRLHYANCKAYNADFDGDEMNAHFPQNELARSEGYMLANVCNQYLVPKDGTPLSGLIQDHMVSGVRMSVRGRFFCRNDYQQLVYQALPHQTTEIILLPPAIVKPKCLWSGKQIISTVIINITPRGRNAIHLTATAKIGTKAWQNQKPREWKAGGTLFTNPNDMSEAEVVIRNGELHVGVLDKTHYGATPYGLIHCMYELYGGTYATRLLNAFAKLFMSFLQHEGFTLGVHDILVLPKADRKRSKIVRMSRKVGKHAISDALDVSHDTPLEELVEKMEEARFRNPKMRAIIDRQYKSALDSYTNDINKTCLPAGLLCKFPDNNLQLMVQSGAKGSTVNTMQISCLLGQIELEGKRPPIMISGKSLPSFPVFEFAPRAGGFIDGRFMTGIKPQEFFFHCMAGREGLIDTAVKTSRSGYLQRCLIKHLEGLTVNYDLTVRDSDKSVVQFLYGEDGMDVSKAQFLNKKQLPFLAENCKAIIDKNIVKELRKSEEGQTVDKHNKRLEEWKSAHGDLLQKKRKSPFALFSEVVKGKLPINHPHKRSKKTGREKLTKRIIDLWESADNEIKDSFKNRCEPCPNPANADFQPDCYYGAMTEHMESFLTHCDGNKKKKERTEIHTMLKYKAMHSLCVPGESVGLLAAQSIGEPSTQMTLNTFHFAGRGEMNVTLGIPRLREILMMASKNIKTPSMEIPFLNVPNLEKKAENLRKLLTRVVVSDVLEKIDVTMEIRTEPVRQQEYMLRFHFLPYHLYQSEYHVKPKKILKHMSSKFFGIMFQKIRKYAKINSNVVLMDKEVSSAIQEQIDDENADNADAEQKVAPKKGKRRDKDDESDSSDEEVEDTENAKQTHKFDEAHDEQEPEEEEREQLSEDETEEPKAEEPADEDDSQELDDEEESNVKKAYHLAQLYKYDRKEHLWCELTFSLPLSYKKLNLTSILKEAASISVLWETANIKRAITYMENNSLMLRTDGINIGEMFKYRELLDLNKLYSNDIHKISETYGVEAATKVIVKEVQEVFKVYGITVDPRHLLLIADYMMFNGTFEPLSRRGMESNASPLQQMSFEASLNFLKTATVRGKQDQLQSPSSCLMIGKPCHTGTGCFTLLQKLPTLSATS